jgi:NifU-like protein involved in Fe-S cluster formation
LIGLTRNEVAALHDCVAAMLDGAEPPTAPFDAFSAFDGVADHKSRHRCVLLPFEAVLAALDASESSHPG